jgi:hypothetical protein
MAPLAFRNTSPSHAFHPKDKKMNYVDPVGEQPYAARWWKARSTTDYDDPDPNRDPEKKLYDEMTSQKIQDNPNEANAGDRTGYVHAQVYGPYTLKPGESAKIVMAYAAGHPAQMRADSKQGMGAMDLLTWDRSNEPVERKQAEMKTLGEQALLENLRLAQFAYDSEYHIPATPEADRLERKVRVVPNPYYVDGLHNYPNTVNIRFVNLPRKSKIHIYSVSGDWVQTIEHDETVTVETGGVLVPRTTGQKGENIFRQNTWNLSGQISTGLYFFAVVSEVPESMGKVQRGSFVVIK